MSAPVVAMSAPVVAMSEPVVAMSAPVVAMCAPVVAMCAPVVAMCAPVVAMSAPVVAMSAPVVATRLTLGEWDPNTAGDAAGGQFGGDEAGHGRHRGLRGEGWRVRAQGGGGGGTHQGAGRGARELRRPAQAAAGRLHGGVQRHHTQAQRDVPDDHPRRRRGTQ
eukprot:5428019-Pyramimonas_sp.AAC.3